MFTLSSGRMTEVYWVLYILVHRDLLCVVACGVRRNVFGVHIGPKALYCCISQHTATKSGCTLFPLVRSYMSASVFRVKGAVAACV